MGTEGRSSWNKQRKSLLLFPPCFILHLYLHGCNWDHAMVASVQSVFSFLPSHLILMTILQGTYPHQHLILWMQRQIQRG